MLIEFNPKNLAFFPELFSDKTREMCKSCKRYSFKATCPPNVEKIEYYRKLISSYNNGVLLIEHFIIENKEQWRELGKSSSLVIHNKLLEERQRLLDEGKLAIIFGAGSCKYCSEICNLPCKHPDKSIVPLEATGMNVTYLVDLLTNIGIKFPVKEEFYRVGLILWD